MIRAAIAVAILIMALMAVFGGSEAAPIAPIPPGLTSDVGNPATQVYWHHRHWGHWCRWHRC
jgi:hypothetical protein